MLVQGSHALSNTSWFRVKQASRKIPKESKETQISVSEETKDDYHGEYSVAPTTE